MIFEYDKVVIGSCLDAVLCAFNNQYPIFFTNPARPFRFNYLPPAANLECLKINQLPKSLTTPHEQKVVGVSEEILWERLLYLLSLEGNSPLSDLCHSIRYDGERVVCSNEYSKIFEFKFNECLYFDDASSHGFVSKNTLDEDSYICYDYIAFNSGGKHEIDYLHTGDDFVSEIWFYSSDRIDGDTPVRDACAVSRLTERQLLNFDYSETMARFKAVYEMELKGMKGKFAHGFTTAGNPKHYKFRTTSIGRKTHRQRDSYEPQSANIKIAKVNTQSMLRDLPASSLAYDRFLRHW
jgi:hypothetical protein